MIYISMFMAALFTTAHRQKLPRYPAMDEWIKKNVEYTHNGTLYSHKKEVDSDICYNMDKPRGRHDK